MCDCHDHPLEHAIWQALEAFENGRPRVSVGAIVGQLRLDLAEWRGEQEWEREERARQRAIGEREQASADGEVW